MMAYSKSEWENEIARHILAVFATSKADRVPDPYDSKIILDFVDTDKSGTTPVVVLICAVLY